MHPRPNVLVLGGGGILGEAWMSAVLAGLDEATGFDPRACDGYVGTSAGSIVAAALVAGVDPRARLGELPEQPPLAGAAGVNGASLGDRAIDVALGAGRTIAAPLAAVGLRATEVPGALLRRALLRRSPRGRRSLAGLADEIERMGARWDGRLSISAVDVERGHRVMFGADGAPNATVADAVCASCAIPGVFRPLVLDGRSYVDGGVWSPTNMDRAPAARGASVLCLNPTGSLRPGRGAPFGAIGVVSGSLAQVEALALRRRGAAARIISPDAASVEAMGPNLMDARPRAAVIAAGLAQGRALA